MQPRPPTAPSVLLDDSSGERLRILKERVALLAIEAAELVADNRIALVELRETITRSRQLRDLPADG